MKTAFTMIEVIATLLLVAVLALSVAISLLPMAQGLMQVRANADTAQKARLAMSRISRELTTVTNVAALGASDITYDFLVPVGSWYAVRRHTLAWDGTVLTLQEGGGPVVPLSDDVAQFDVHLRTTPGADMPTIDVVLLSRETGTVFSNAIAARNVIGGGP